MNSGTFRPNVGAASDHIAARPAVQQPSPSSEDISRTVRPGIASLRKGDLIANRYSVLGEPKEGGMCLVYRVMDTQRGGEILAVKILRSELLSNEALRRLLEKEGPTGWTLLMHIDVDHKYIVKTIDWGCWHLPNSTIEIPYVVMEYINGCTLKEWMQSYSESRLPDPVEVFTYTEQIALGIMAAHQARVLHRDLKPENVLLAGDREHPIAKVTDFGISSWIKDDRGTRSTGPRFATPGWAAPELMELNAEEGYFTDVYSLGKILYYLLTSRRYPPYAKFYQQVGGSRHMPHTVDEMIHRACAENSNDRFPNMSSFLEEFQRVRHRYEKLRVAGLEDEEADPERRRQQDERIRELKAIYRWESEKPQPSWEDRLPILEELMNLGMDEDIRRWIDERNEHLRPLLTADLKCAIKQLDDQRFNSTLEEANGVLSADELRDFDVCFRETLATNLAAQDRYAEAVEIIESLLIQAELKPAKREQFLNTLRPWNHKVQEQALEHVCHKIDRELAKGQLDSADEALKEAGGRFGKRIELKELEKRLNELRKKKKADKLIIQAHAELTKRCFGAAFELAQEARQLDPGSPLLGELFEHIDKEWKQFVIEVDGEVRVNIKGERLDAAKDYLRDAVERLAGLGVSDLMALHRELASALVREARRSFSHRQYTKALDFARDAVELDAESREAHIIHAGARAAELIDVDELVPAKEILKQAKKTFGWDEVLATVAEQLRARTNRRRAADLVADARQLVEEREFAKALLRLDQARQLDTAHPGIAELLQQIEQGQRQLCREMCETARKLIDAEDFDEAERVLEKAAKLFYGDDTEVRSTVQHLSYRRRLSQAAAIVREVRPLVEGFRELQRAIERLQHARGLDPKDQTIASLLMAAEVAWSIERRDLRQASKLLAEAERHCLENELLSRLRDRLKRLEKAHKAAAEADRRLKAGRLGEARALSVRAQELDPDDDRFAQLCERIEHAQVRRRRFQRMAAHVTHTFRLPRKWPIHISVALIPVLALAAAAWWWVQPHATGTLLIHAVPGGEIMLRGEFGQRIPSGIPVELPDGEYEVLIWNERFPEQTQVEKPSIINGKQTQVTVKFEITADDFIDAHNVP